MRAGQVLPWCLYSGGVLLLRSDMRLQQDYYQSPGRLLLLRHPGLLPVRQRHADHHHPLAILLHLPQDGMLRDTCKRREEQGQGRQGQRRERDRDGPGQERAER